MTLFIGLTGSIGMGKSTAANQWRRMKVPIHDADAVVHRLLASDGAAFPAVIAAFPDVMIANKIDRRLLGQKVFNDNAALKKLENILHPLVQQAEQNFRRRVQQAGFPLAILDIPLLYETGAERRIGIIAVVTAPVFIQHQRVLQRPGMDKSRLAAILSRQWPDYQKRKKAEIVIHTGLGRAWSWRQWSRLRRQPPTITRPINFVPLFTPWQKSVKNDA